MNMIRQKFVSKKLAPVLTAAAVVLTPGIAGMVTSLDAYAAEQSIDAGVEEAVDETAPEATEEPASEAVAEPAQEISEEAVPETTAEPVQQVSEEPASEAVAEPVQEITQEIADEPATETIDETAQEPSAEVAEETSQEVVSEPEQVVATRTYIRTNEERLYDNYHTITFNKGKIMNNNAYVYHNKAEIINNDDYGIVDDNSMKITSNKGTVNDNNYEIADNNGVVYGNRALIINNNGYIELNDNNAEVMENDGHIERNYGDVDNNTGIVVENGDVVSSNAGLIVSNNGTVGINIGNVVENYGKVNIAEEGTVQKNYISGMVYGSSLKPNDDRANTVVVAHNRGGTVVSGLKSEDLLTISNYYDGELRNVAWTADGEVACEGKILITNKFGEKGDTDKDFITVENQYNSVEVYDADNTDITFDGFVLDDVDNTQYILTAQNGEPVELAGTITLKAKEGYSLSDNGELSGSADKLTYSLNKNEDGSYTVSISSLTGDVAVTPEMLNLIVSEISDDVQEVLPDSPQGDRIDEVTEIESKTLEQIPCEVKTVAPRGGSDAHSYKIMEFSFGDNIKLSAETVKALCTGPQNIKRCLFNFEGKQYVMTVPVVDTSSPEYVAALDELLKESDQTVDFWRILEIFKDLGFTISEVAQ